MWAQSNTGKSSNLEQQAWILSQGGYGAIPPEAIHTFEIADPDIELAVVFEPGGTLQELLVAIQDGTSDSAIGSPFDPAEG